MDKRVRMRPGGPSPSETQKSRRGAPGSGTPSAAGGVGRARKGPLPVSAEAWGGTDGGVRGGQEEADRGGSALRTLIDLGTETSAILLALRGAVAQPVGEPGSGEEGESGDFEDENHCRVRRVAWADTT